jgi:hypothetical protein
LRRWFKASISLVVISIVAFFIDVIYAIEIDSYFGYGRVPISNSYPSVSLIILFSVGIIFVLAYFAFLMGAKPVLERELLGKKQKQCSYSLEL